MRSLSATTVLFLLSIATPFARADDGARERPTVAIIDGKEAPVPSISMGDSKTIDLIIAEGRDRSQVMKHLHHLTVEGGPRLTGSTRAEAANRWCQSRYEEWGLTNAHVEEWGVIATRFDRGPSGAKLMLRKERTRDDGQQSEITFDEIRTLEFASPAWTKGTTGPRRGPIVRMPNTEDEYKAAVEGGKLNGAWVLIKAPPPVGRRGVQERMSSNFQSRLDARKKMAEGGKKEDLTISQRLIFDGIAGFVSASRDERVWTSSAPGWRERKIEDYPDDLAIVVRRSDYDALNSRVADGDPVELEVDMKHDLSTGPDGRGGACYNTVAEIKGTQWPDQCVIISAHLDSWDGPGSLGTTDNATGSSTTLEAARILAAAIKNGGTPPKRTIRFINWTGEEQGLLGSRWYCEHYKDELLKNVSCVLVDDGGTNYDGGIGAEPQMIDYLAAATAPVNNVFYSDTDKKYLNVNVRSVKSIAGGSQGGGSSDHASFNRIGVPGFFWDEVGRADYGHGWHTQNDKYELGIEEYLRQSATCAAVTAYNLACAPELLPRSKPADEKKPDEKSNDEKNPAKPAEAPNSGQTGTAGNAK